MMMNKDAYIKISIAETGEVEGSTRGTALDLMFLWAVVGRQICMDHKLMPNLLALSFLACCDQLGDWKPTEQTIINLSAVERAKEAADHAED